jgi:hypothetical protein
MSKSLFKVGNTALGTFDVLSDSAGVVTLDVSSRLKSLTASATLTTADAGKLIVLNAAAGLTVTLPAATGTGKVYEIIVGTSVTSNTAVIQVADASHTISGIILAADDTGTPAPLVWVAGATADTITLDGDTQGGLVGDRLILTDIATNKFAVTGTVKQANTEATPFSAGV